MPQSTGSETGPTARPGPTRLIIAEVTTVVMPRHIKLRHDAGRGVWLILAPERVFSPDPIAVEVLRMLDGRITVGGIADKLAADYQAPRDQILGDIVAMLQDLADKGVVRAPPPA